MNNEMIINFAPTGIIPTKEISKYTPISIQEIISDVYEAYEMGITMVHLHARDQVSGKSSCSIDIYGELISGIRSFAPDLIICVSLSGRNFKAFEDRAAPLSLDGNLKPDMGSLTLSSVNFNKEASVNSPEMIIALADEMNRRGILQELEVFDLGMINNAKYLEKRGLLVPPHYFNLLFGNISCAQADLLHFGVMLNDLPNNSYWSVAGIGDYQLKMNSVSIAAGGGVRVGLEDNIWYDLRRTKLARNIDLIRRVHILAEANERQIMSPSHLRNKLNLAAGYGEYGRVTNDK